MSPREQRLEAELPRRRQRPLVARGHPDLVGLLLGLPSAPSPRGGDDGRGALEAAARGWRREEEGPRQRRELARWILKF